MVVTAKEFPPESPPPGTDKALADDYRSRFLFCTLSSLSLKHKDGDGNYTKRLRDAQEYKPLSEVVENPNLREAIKAAYVPPSDKTADTFLKPARPVVRTLSRHTRDFIDRRIVRTE